jgi:hypothetical protein
MNLTSQEWLGFAADDHLSATTKVYNKPRFQKQIIFFFSPLENLPANKNLSWL